MNTAKTYHGLDVLKFGLALLVAERHIIQIFFPESSRWHHLIGAWLSNLPVPVFFTIAGFFLFRKCRSEAEDASSVKKYVLRIFKMYLIWCAIYLPIDLYNWSNDAGVTFGAFLKNYLHRFLFDSTIPQLWYLPALAIACLIVWFLAAKGLKTGTILVIGFLLLIVGWVGNNWWFNQRLPQSLQHLLFDYYCKAFITTRNGVFYGVFYVALGRMFARTKKRLPFLLTAAGSLLFLGVMYWETTKYFEVNIILSAAPAAYFVFSAAEALNLPDSRLWPRLRGMSQWVYLAHFYFFHFLVWLRPWNPVPFNSKSITAMIILPLLLFSWIMVRLAELPQGKWLKALI